MTQNSYLNSFRSFFSHNKFEVSCNISKSILDFLSISLIEFVPSEKAKIHIVAFSFILVVDFEPLP